MRFLLYVSALVFTFPCFGNTKYRVLPQGGVQSSGKGEEAHLKLGKLKKAEIYKEVEGIPIFYGVVKKKPGWGDAYVFEVADDVLSTHKAYFFSWGSLFNYLKEFEIKDENGLIIGYVEGFFFTKYAAEFHFYTPDGEIVAKVLLEKEKKKIRITSPSDEVILIGLRVDDGRLDNEWSIENVENRSFDSRFLWPLFIFMIENWGY